MQRLAREESSRADAAEAYEGQPDDGLDARHGVLLGIAISGLEDYTV